MLFENIRAIYADLDLPKLAFGRHGVRRLLPRLPLAMIFVAFCFVPDRHSPDQIRDCSQLCKAEEERNIVLVRRYP